ncbi:unnamed protein product [Rotaria socialis]|uniref:Uncharacterized protein n=1 Tax=Rotaria socialis TaxID=392032 RepID=A0A821M1Z2_9BILA|nr:unnamed protein product [Rotaria socialis]CAF3625508.1 unnamed protein product [Rotaria socialis]CAF4563254.1 unnamed protein product [Rotaria socialis]CAF4760898.1 unnamed protein product [Rotaria socialis]
MTSLTKNLEGLTIVWLDVDRIHQNTDDYFDTKNRLRQCNNYIEIYHDPNECIHGIIANGYVFLIVSGSICETFIPLIFEIKQIVFIYVLYSDNQLTDTCELKTISKLHGIFSSKNQLIEKLKQDVKSYLKSLPLTCIVNEKSIRALNKEYSTFMWTQLLMDVLIQIPQTDRAKMMMLEDCRLHYADNKAQLDDINEFQEKYEPDFAVWWYTRESFAYKQLNQALRTQDIDIIFKYQFFIRDLYVLLKELYEESMPSLEEISIVYRGQHINCDELEKIKNNVNGLISMNSFLSTTRNKNRALISAGDGSNRPSLESILFEITINKNVAAKTKPFADITKMSQFGKAEEEILLSIGSIFKIQSVEQLAENAHVWDVKLILNESVVINEIDMLFNYFKMNSTTSISNVGTLGLLLGEMGEYEKAEKYYQMMLDELSTDHCGVPIILNNMGVLYNDMGNDEKALEYYKKSYESYKMQNVSENDLLLANLYHNMGSLYYENEYNKTALKYFKKAFKICNNNSTLPSLLLSATLYTDVSGIYQDNEDSVNALDQLQHTFEIQKRILPSTHFRIAATYNNIGSVYLCKGDYAKALENFEIALNIGLKSLPADHEHIQTYRENIKHAKERIK